jgi:hypothetical protein
MSDHDDTGAPVETPEQLEPPGKDGSGPLTDGQLAHAKRFYEWLLGLNRHDYMEASAKVLNPLMRAYFKHTVKVHSPPSRKSNDVSGTPSEGAPNPSVPDPKSLQ